MTTQTVTYQTADRRCTSGIYEGDEVLQCQKQAGHDGEHEVALYPRQRVVYHWLDADQKESKP